MFQRQIEEVQYTIPLLRHITNISDYGFGGVAYHVHVTLSVTR